MTTPPETTSEAVVPGGGSDEEDTNAQPLLPSPAIPTTAADQPLPTLNPGG